MLLEEYRGWRFAPGLGASLIFHALLLGLAVFLGGTPRPSAVPESIRVKFVAIPASAERLPVEKRRDGGIGFVHRKIVKRPKVPDTFPLKSPASPARNQQLIQESPREKESAPLPASEVAQTAEGSSPQEPATGGEGSSPQEPATGGEESAPGMAPQAIFVNPIKVPAHLLGMGLFPRRYRIVLSWEGGQVRLEEFRPLGGAPQEFVDGALERKLRQALNSGGWDVGASTQGRREGQRDSLDVEFRE